MKIIVDTERMNECSIQIRGLNSQIESNVGTMAFLVQDMDQSWQSEAERAYADRLEDIRRKFMDLERFFDDYASLLARFAEEYRQYEEELADRIAEI